MSLSVTELAELVDATAYPVLLEAAAAQPAIFPQFCKVNPITTDMLYGTKGTVLGALGEFRRRRDGGALEHDRVGKSHTWQVAFHPFSKILTIPMRLADASNAAGKIGDMVAGTAQKAGSRAITDKDRFVAAVMQKGTLTAGSLDYFDNSFVDNADPNPKFIYDGLPFFDTAHTDNAGSTYSNHEAGGSLTSANLETYLQTIRQTNAKDDRGGEMVIEPDVIVVPPGLEFTAARVLNSALTAGTANNDVNALQGRLRPVVNRYLSDAASASAGWIGQAGAGLEVWDSGIPQVRTGVDLEHGNYIVTFEYHFGVTVTDWRFWFNFGKAAS